MKKIGMIGGVSWESTIPYYKLINEKVNETLGGLYSPQIILFSMNYQELVDYKNQNQWNKIAERLSEVAIQLERSGADCVLLCCNTLHKVADKIESTISIPFIHIVDTLGLHLQKENIQKIGLLGTQFTLEDGFYHARLKEKFQIDVIVPEKVSRLALDSIIYDELCKSIISKESQNKLIGIINELIEQQVQAIVLGCTELGLLVSSKMFTLPIFDTTVLHARMAASLVLQK